MMTCCEYYARCARVVGFTQSSSTMTFVYYQTYLKKIEEEKLLPGISLKRSRTVRKDLHKFRG